VKLRGYSKFVSIFIVSMNFILIRVDAFLQNLITFLTYVIYQMMFLSLLAGPLTIPLSTSLLISLYIHLLYSITYIINDFINYYDDRSLSYDQDRYSFYKLRIIQFLGRRLEGFVIQVSYYTIILCILFYLLRKYHITVYSTILTVLTFIILSVIESFSRKRTLAKHFSFTLQQITKVFVFSYVLNTIHLRLYSELVLVTFISWGLIFIGYVTLRGVFENVCYNCSSKENNLVKNIPLSLLRLLYRRPFIALLSLSLYLSIVVLYIYLAVLIGRLPEIFIVTGLSHLMLAPIWLFYFILARILGEKDRNIYRLLTRLTLKLIFLIAYYLISNEMLLVYFQFS
jgi:hypothetical protein